MQLLTWPTIRTCAVLHPHVLQVTTLTFDRSVLRKFRKGTSVFAFTTFAGAGQVAVVKQYSLCHIRT